ncbi:hypothetical protein V8G54_004990 [Vigna mungo]|uniref:Uncharacterized protein n=1 Tax=Vigna mungo TaxID=3915 RepID=A0AAQ3SG22_VIGMU
MAKFWLPTICDEEVTVEGFENGRGRDVNGGLKEIHWGEEGVGRKTQKRTRGMIHPVARPICGGRPPLFGLLDGSASSSLHSQVHNLVSKIETAERKKPQRSNRQLDVTSLCAGRWMSRPMTSARVEYSALLRLSLRSRGDKSEVAMEDGSNRLLLRTGYDDEIQGTDISLRNSVYKVCMMHCFCDNTGYSPLHVVVVISTYDDRTCTGVDDIADKTGME